MSNENTAAAKKAARKAAVEAAVKKAMPGIKKKLTADAAKKLGRYGYGGFEHGAMWARRQSTPHAEAARAADLDMDEYYQITTTTRSAYSVLELAAFEILGPDGEWGRDDAKEFWDSVTPEADELLMEPEENQLGFLHGFAAGVYDVRNPSDED